MKLLLKFWSLIIKFFNSNHFNSWRKDTDFEVLLSKYWRSAPTCDFRIVNSSTLDTSSLLKLFEKNEPVLIKQLSLDWRANTNWKKGNFLSLYGHYITRVGSQSSIVYSGGAAEVPTLLKDLVGAMDSNSEGPYNNSNSTFLFDTEILYNIPSLWRDFTIPEVFSSWDSKEAENERKMWHILSLGPSRTGLPFHNHGKTWLGVVHGAKQWFLYPLGYGPPPEIEKQFSATVSVFEWFMTYLPLLANFPKPNLSEPTINNRGYHPLMCLQNAGDIIFIPSQWSHMTINIGETIAVGGQQHLSDEERWANAAPSYRKNPFNYEACKDLGLSLYNEAKKALKTDRSSVPLIESGILLFHDFHDFLELKEISKDSWVVFKAYSDTMGPTTYSFICYDEHWSLAYVEELAEEIRGMFDLNIALVNSDERDSCFNPMIFSVRVELYKGYTNDFHPNADNHMEVYDGSLSRLANYVADWANSNDLLSGSYNKVTVETKNKFRTAAMYFQKAISLRSFQPEVFTMLCDALSQIRDFRTLENTLTNVETYYDRLKNISLKENTNNSLGLSIASLYHKIASVYFDMNMIDQAIPLVQKSLQAFPCFVPSMRDYVYIMIVKGDKQKATEAMKELKSMMINSNPDVYDLSNLELALSLLPS